MAIQMRRGPLANYDKSKMLPGEWGISIDNDSDNQKAFIAFAPGVDKEVLFVEDAEPRFSEMTEEATEEAEAWAHGNSFHFNDYASGDGSTRVFTLTYTPYSIIGVYVDDTAVSNYTVSEKTITLSAAPPSGSNNIRVYYVVNTTSDNARYYKEQAASSASSAYTSRTSAAESASSALSSAGSASSSASSASSSASTASTKAEEAANSASAASGSASTASTKASEASTSAGNASNSASTASTQAGNAEAWAVGTKSGADVPSTDPQYHNNAKYYADQMGTISSDVDQLKNAITTKAEQEGAYPDLTAGQLLSKNEASDSVPYNFRAVGHDATLEYTDAIVGGSVVQNQLFNQTRYKATGYTEQGLTVTNVDGKYLLINGDFSGSGYLTCASDNNTDWIAGHKYLFDVPALPSGVTGGTITTYGSVFGSSIKNGATILNALATSNSVEVYFRFQPYSATTITNFKYYVNIYDLTQALGTTIADYIYTLETATEGSGVAWLRKHFPKLFTYQEYNTGEIVSVQGLSQHVTRDVDNNILGTCPLDDSLTLRGILKLDSNNNLYADGDRYLPDGTVQRRYGVVDLGTLNWEYNASTFGGSFYTSITNSGYATTGNAMCTKYPTVYTGASVTNGDKVLYAKNNGVAVYAKDTAYTDAATFKAAMSGVYLVYELAEPTTDTAEPYTNPQIIDPNGTEEYVSTSIVPVGHESRYPLDIAGRLDKILTMPTANGTYTLRATVNNGAVSYAWVST